MCLSAVHLPLSACAHGINVHVCPLSTWSNAVLSFYASSLSISIHIGWSRDTLRVDDVYPNSSTLVRQCDLTTASTQQVADGALFHQSSTVLGPQAASGYFILPPPKPAGSGSIPVLSAQAEPWWHQLADRTHE